ncbi:MAG: hypothetical protein HYY06_07745 [Deltaproteobacteria bacterium]|nr:hypothetical protein [Deltaproteobacteria bacterium]
MTRHGMIGSPSHWLVALAALAWAGCGDDDDDTSQDEAPILDPEPPGSPSEVVGAGSVDFEISCLGDNSQPDPNGTNLTLPGWIRDWNDPTNDGGVQPEADAEAYDEVSTLGTSSSDIGNGRVAISVPVEETGFVGTVRVTADDYLEQHFRVSRPVTTTKTAGWMWLVRQSDVDAVAAEADIEVDPDRAIVVGAVHDCLGFGYSNAIIRWGDSTDGVLYFDGFTPAPERTFTAESGRFAIAGVPEGPLTVEAYGRLDGSGQSAGPLTLLGRIDIEVSTSYVSAIALEPRVGVER